MLSTVHLLLLVATLGAPNAGPGAALAADLPPDEAPSRAGDVRAAPNYEAALDSLLSAVVGEDGLVRYDLLQGDLNLSFRQILKAVEDYDGSLEGVDEKLAFWMNAYNVQMLQNVIENPQVDNIVDDGYADRFFKTPFLTARRSLTLDEIEHVVLRADRPDSEHASLALPAIDARIHVGVNCAAVSCPSLRRRAFTPGNVDDELERALQDFVDDERHFRVVDQTLVVSSLVDWFGDDFSRLGSPFGTWLAKRMRSTRPAALRRRLCGKSVDDLRQDSGVRFEYDWTVNSAR